MDDFARMMLQEGVRPLDQKDAAKPNPAPAGTQPHQAPPPVSNPTSATPSGPSWSNGPNARKALENAISMIAEDRANGRPSWITGIRQDGRSMTLRSQATFGEIVSAADREDLRLIVLGGETWTCVMHPGMGIATIETNIES